MDRKQPIRVGLLGAARAAVNGIIGPARRTPGVRIGAIASRSLEKASAFARAHSIPRPLGTYDALLDDPSIDAVYIGLPTALHGAWALRALEHGKHVLCEKPLAINAFQARLMTSEASKRGLVLQEGLQLRFLPTLRRQLEIARSGTLGDIRRLVSIFRHPGIPMAADDFRLDFALGGGAALDLGCYAVACMLYVAGEAPQVLTSKADCIRSQVDQWMRSTLKFPSGITGVVECGFRGAFTPSFGLSVECELGTLSWGPRGVVCAREGRVVTEECPAVDPYDAQLAAFLGRVRGELSEVAAPEQAIATAEVLDAMYERAGLAPRVGPVAA
jgi:predicted dehydrogenase